MDEFKMDEMEVDEIKLDEMEADDMEFFETEPDESRSHAKDCCEEERKTIEPCDKLIVRTRDITVNLDKCSGRLILVPVTLENVCKDIPVNVAVIICEKWKVIGMVIKQLDKRNHSHRPCSTINKTFCIPIDRDICNKKHIKIKVIAAYAPREKCPDDCDCDRRHDCDSDGE